MEDLNTQLIDAVKVGDNELAKKCLQNGADPNYYINNYIHMRDECKQTLLFEATIRNNVEMIKLLVQNEATVNENNGYALSRASENGNYELVEFLLKHGADPSINNQWALIVAENDMTRNLLYSDNRIDLQKALETLRSYPNKRAWKSQIDDLENFMDSLPDVKVAK